MKQLQWTSILIFIVVQAPSSDPQTTNIGPIAGGIGAVVVVMVLVVILVIFIR